MAAPGGANQITRRVINDLIKFSEETSVDGYMSFFKSQQITKSHGFINRMREEANTARNFIGDDREAVWTKLQGLNELIAQAEQEIKTKEAQIQTMNGLRYGSILTILQGRNELLEKIIGIMETQAIDPDDLVNYDNDNDIEDLGYESEVYLDEEEEDDENNHSNGIVVKRGITRISRKHRELFSSFLGDLLREHIGLKILSWKKVGSETRDKLWDEITVKSAAAKMTRSKSVYQHTMGRGGYALVKEKMIKKKEIEPDEEPPRGTLETDIQKGSQKRPNQARDGKDKVNPKPKKDKLPRSRQASDERILLLQSQLDNERRERQEKELLIQNLSNKMSQTEGMVTTLKNQLAAQGGQFQSMSTQLTPPNVSPVDINPINSSADEEGGTTVFGCENDASIQKSNGLATLEKEMETRVSNKTSPCETVKSVGSKKMTRSIRKDSSRQDSQSQENVSPLLVLPQATKCKLGHLKKSTIIALVDAACIPDVGNNGFKTVKDAVGGFFAWPKDQVVFDPKATPPSTIQMNVENKTAPKLHTKRKNVYVSSDAMQRQAKKKSLQKSLNY
ncbi:hypothetical protein Tco_1301210 [Tanacetum coccineum]